MRGSGTHPVRREPGNGCVADEVQAEELQSAAPADPAIPGTALEGAELPAGEADPMSPPLEHVSQSPSGEALEAELVVSVRQRIPAAALLRFGEADDDLR